MSLVRLRGGKYVVCRRTNGCHRYRIKNKFSKTPDKSLRDWYLIKNDFYGKGYLLLNTIYFPKELVGKRIRLVVEVIKRGK